ncbi:uncharacterized protein B0H64DRAFT_438384 [Chaetomium fimeti]|uniref:Uncharacterized protein n=1 Tax=Chaetomium fimeti TaxID=1854472 RepID=A0AAE0HRB7_9PEZI|nr:hypothetical protein B0H64DRAFT_438384 [Chaetomium fimeti]
MVNSLVWSPEEAKYLKAIFRWQETEPSLDEERKRQQAEEDERRRQQEEKPAGEFRVLVIGGRGTGKTAILTRFGQGTFHGETEPPDPFYERGCRHPITLEVTPTSALPTSATAHALTTSSPTTTIPTPKGTTTKSYSVPHLSSSKQPSSPPLKHHHNNHHNHNHNHNNHYNHHHHQPTPQNPTPKQQTQTQTQTYLIDALEMPSNQLLSNPLLAQALSITEAAVLVYSARDAASLQLAQGLAEFMREHFAPASPTSVRSGGVGGVDRGRAYPIVLVGNKSEVEDAGGDGGGGGEEKVVVSRAVGLRAARGMGVAGCGVADVPFLEVSAKTGEGVVEVFEVVGREVLRVRRAVRERREVAERERLMSAVGSVQTAGGEGRRRWRALWRTLFGRREVVEGAR